MDDPIARVGSLVSQELLDALNGVLPPLTPKPGDSMDEIMYAAGGLKMLEFLQSCFDYVNETKDED